MSEKQQSGSKKDEIQIQYVNINSIHVPENRRKLNEEIVKELQASIRDVGLLSPINVTQKNGTIILSAGDHRLEACRRLGWEKIPAIVLNLDSLNLEAAALDENLVRAELSDFERSITLARRKEIYELLHPESKKGGTRRPKPNDLVSAPPFTKVHSARTGETKSEVEYQVKVGKALGPFAEKIRGSTLENKFVDLLKLSRVKDDRQREAAIDSILTKKAGSVAEIENVIPAAWENLPWQEILVADIKIYNDDFKSVNRGRTVIPPNSVDLLISDPDWISKNALSNWEELAPFARRVLRPRAFAIVFLQSRFLRPVMQALDEKLHYHWTCCGLSHDDEEVRSNFRSNWRPILIYYKGPHPGKHLLVDDVLRTNVTSRREGKSETRIEASYSYLLKKFATKESMILDPVCGDGAILIEAAKLGMKAKGIDRYKARCDRAEKLFEVLKSNALVAKNKEKKRTSKSGSAKSSE